MSRRRAHERTLARARAKREAQQRLERRRRRITVAIVGLVALLLVAALVGSVIPGRVSAPEVEDPTAADPQATASALVACGGSRPEAAERGKPRYDAPEQVTEPGVDYRARIVTSCGTIVVDLDENGAPRTVNSFVFLGREGFFDGITFHRVEPGFVIQSGDPTGTGGGGPGYTVEDELATAREQGYPAGTLAMANSGPNTSGSQFFITLEQPERLPPNYTAFGRVVEGMDVVQRIGAVPVRRDPNSGFQTPDETIYIEAITIEPA